MPKLIIKHITTYRYRRAVAFGEHAMMLRPRDSHDQRLLDEKLEITPTPIDTRLTRDAFENHVRIVRFAGRAKELRFASTIRLEHSHLEIHDLKIDETANAVPFGYGAHEMPDLVRFVERKPFDPEHHVDEWARAFLRRNRHLDNASFSSTSLMRLTEPSSTCAGMRRASRPLFGRSNSGAGVVVTSQY